MNFIPHTFWTCNRRSRTFAFRPIIAHHNNKPYRFLNLILKHSLCCDSWIGSRIRSTQTENLQSHFAAVTGWALLHSAISVVPNGTPIGAMVRCSSLDNLNNALFSHFGGTRGSDGCE